MIDLRNCDCCRKQSDSVDQSSCLTSHIDENKYSFKITPCPSDYFYCKECLDENGNFCKDCDKTISKENQSLIVTDFYKF